MAKTTTYEPKNEPLDFTLEPTDPSSGVTPKNVTSQFVMATTTDPEDDDFEPKIAGRFEVTMHLVIDGMEAPKVARAASAKAALAQVIKQAFGNQLTLNDFVEPDYEDEHFKQSYKAPEADPLDVMGNKIYDDIRDEMLSLVSDAESAAEAAAESEATSQDDNRALSATVARMFELCKGDRKKVAAFFTRPGANAPVMARAAASPNGLYEMQMLANLPDAVYECYPRGIVSGKGVIGFRNGALAAAVSKGAIAAATSSGMSRISEDPDNPVPAIDDSTPTVEQLDNLLRLIAGESFGVEGAGSLDTLADVAEAMDAIATEKHARMTDPNQEIPLGKDVVVSNKEAYELTKQYNGFLFCTSLGEGLVASAAKSVAEAANIEDDAARVEALKKVTGSRGNSMLYQAVKTAQAHAKSLSDGANAQAAFDAVVEGENDKVAKATKATAPKLTVKDAVSYYLSHVNMHPKRRTVLEEMVRQARLIGMEDDKPESASDVAEEVATAAE